MLQFHSTLSSYQELESTVHLTQLLTNKIVGAPKVAQESAEVGGTPAPRLGVDDQKIPVTRVRIIHPKNAPLHQNSLDRNSPEYRYVVHEYAELQQRTYWVQLGTTYTGKFRTYSIKSVASVCLTNEKYEPFS